MGELVVLTFEQTCGEVEWEWDDGDIPAAPSKAATVTWTAPDRANDSVTITAQGEQGSASITFKVVEPSDVKMESFLRLHHFCGGTGFGMLAKVYVFPDDVCFCNIRLEELPDYVQADVPGPYEEFNGAPHVPPGPQPGTENVRSGFGTKIGADDCYDRIYSGDPEVPLVISGQAKCRCPFQFCVGTGEWKGIAIEIWQQAELFEASEVLRSSKAGASEMGIVNGPVSWPF